MSSQPQHQPLSLLEDHDPIYYRLLSRGGNRVTLVFIHGLGSNHSRWNEYTANTRLRHHANLLVPDLRGHGYSPKRMAIGHHIWCEDIHSIVEQRCLNPVIMVGHSLGAQTAMHYYHRYGNQVKAMILLDPIFPDCLYSYRRAPYYRLLLKIMVAMVTAANRLGIYRRRTLFRDLEQLDNEVRVLMRDDNKVAIKEIYMKPSIDLQHNCVSTYLQDSMAVFDPLPDEHYRVPVLALFSRHSSVMDESRARRAAAGLGFEVRRINADHWMLTEQPRLTRETMDDWCLKQMASAGLLE